MDQEQEGLPKVCNDFLYVTSTPEIFIIRLFQVDLAL